MKINRPIFALVCFSAVSFGIQAQDLPLTPVPPFRQAAPIAIPPERPAPFHNASVSLPGEEFPLPDVLVRDAVRVMQERGSVAAKIRQRIDLFGQQLVGSGVYLHQGTPPYRRLRMELRIQTGDEVQSLLQICDGRYLWVHRELENKPLLTRIDMLQVMSASERTARTLPPTVLTQSVSLGGLPRLLETLAKSFDFSQVSEGQLENRPVWVLEGQWTRQVLAELLPDQKEAVETGKPFNLSKLPSHVPHSVVLTLGKADLFPYGVDFRRREAPSDAAKPDGGAKSLVTMEVFDVQFDALLNPQEFVYQPGNREFADGTEEFIKSLGMKVD